MLLFANRRGSQSATLHERQLSCRISSFVNLLAPTGSVSQTFFSRSIGEGKYFEYRMVIATRDRRNAGKLAQHLLALGDVIEFRVSPTGD
jgi:hypothetical protein